MKILLTGATGFLGQAALRDWTARGHEVVAVQRPADEAACSPFVTWDLSEAAPLELFAADIEAVVHMAQSRRHRAFPEDAAEMFAVNVAGTQKLLDLAVALGAKRFCLISSGNVYEPYQRPLVEGETLGPPGYLGASKLAAEILAGAYAGVLDVSVLRLFQPYGPGQSGRLIQDLIRRLKVGEPITLGADGEGMRCSPTYVDDVNAVILDAVTQGWRGTFNVAAPGELSIRGMAGVIARVMGAQPTFAVGSGPSPQVIPQLSKLASVTSLDRFRSFEDGVRATLEG